jgi:hypothetical protein
LSKENAIGSSTEQAVAPATEHGEKKKGVGGSSGDALRTERLTTGLHKEGTQVKRDRVGGRAKSLANKYVEKTKTWRKGFTSTITSSTAEASTQEEQEEERGTLGRIKDRFRQMNLRPRLTSNTFPNQLPPVDAGH